MAMPATRSGRPNNSGTRGGVASTSPFPLAAEQYDKQNEEEFRRQLTEFLDPLRNQLAALTTVLMASMIGNDSGVSGSTVAEALDALVKRSGDTMTGVLNMVAASKFLAAGGAEGGELRLEKPASGSTFSGDIAVDLVNDLLRIFDTGGTSKGAHLDLAVQAASVGSIIITDAYKATQEEAEDGTSNTNYLTPLRAAQGTLPGVRGGLNMTGGGTVSYIAAVLKWTARFIVIGDAKGTENASGNAYIDIVQPTSGSVDVVGTTAVTATAAGIPLAAWQALYYDLDAGSAIGASAFHIIDYSVGTANFVPPPKWVLVAVVNNDTTAVKVMNGMVIASGGTMVWGDQLAPLASPTFTGAPAAPTAAAATNTTQIATTAFVQQEIDAQVAFELLTTGTVSSQAALAIPLTAYTGFKNIMVVIDSLRGANDDDELIVRFSTNGGSSYDNGASNYSFSNTALRDNGSSASLSSAAATSITMNSSGAQLGIGSASNEGIDLTFFLWHRTSTAHWTRCTWHGVYTSGAATPETISTNGGGAREAAQDTDAIQFSMLSGGNIAACNYSVYGMR
jgi:hypothetical protein